METRTRITTLLLLLLLLPPLGEFLLE